MRFYLSQKESFSVEAVLSYLPDEYSFDISPRPNTEWTTVLINDLNFEVDEAGVVVSVWGMCPHTSWLERSLDLPHASYGGLAIKTDTPLERGVSVRLTPRGAYLPAFVDWERGCVKIEGSQKPVVAAKIFPGVTIELGLNGDIASLWLAPQNGLKLKAGG